MLVRLLYASRAAKAVDQEEMDAILRQAKVNNQKSGITGVLCLCRNGGVFLQVLEGSRDAVNRLYARLAADARHSELVLLSYEEIQERRFAGWYMGQVNMARLNAALLLKYSETAALDPYAMSGPAAMALFEELATTAAVVGQG
jgi:hypothetical protein